MSGSQATQNPFRFSTKFADEESGLAYYGYRYYSPGVGRWLSRDPIGEAGGLNLAAFAVNSPISSIDILGLIPPMDLPNWPPLETKSKVECACGNHTTLGQSVRFNASSVPGKRGTAMDLLRVVNNQMRPGGCIETLTISAEGGPTGFSLYDEWSGKTQARLHGDLTEVNTVDAENAARIFGSLAKQFCFCRPCTIWLLSCQVGFKPNLSEAIAKATGCTVMAPKYYSNPILSIGLTIPEWAQVTEYEKGGTFHFWDWLSRDEGWRRTLPPVPFPPNPPAKQ